ncbi:EAL domain-containing protein [Paraburkholderia caffeinitolerans]|uniref:EAL domain-containing protein n=1 Tax=Paraburkholderia caffeinitolerans TaxID=1723730 RepID=UPI0015834E34|nr:EAL domain-containing protein [Paraburkholderia caffeinitolerans]
MTENVPYLRETMEFTTGETGMMSCLWRDKRKPNVLDTKLIGKDPPSPSNPALQGELRVAYQAIVSARSGALTGAEAIAAWSDRPNAPLSERGAAPLGHQASSPPPVFETIFELGCANLARWQRHTPDGVALSIDISLEQLVAKDFTPMVMGCIRRHAIRPECVKFEMPEPRDRNITRTLIERLSDLRRIGVAVVLDDFGMEHSTLSSLIALPISGLKFGRRFTSALPDDRIASAILTSVASLARDLGISIAVDGVQSDAQLAWLRQFANLDVQGSLISSPVSGEAILSWLPGSGGGTSKRGGEEKRWTSFAAMNKLSG